jgi:putative endonuclease
MASQINKHIHTGHYGERTAAEYLLKQGYILLHKNYRYRRSEVDIIARKGQTLVFVEVKTRSTDLYGFPEEAVNYKKEKMLLRAADHYIHTTQWQFEIRFDIISITLATPIIIHHIEDAFH